MKIVYAINYIKKDGRRDDLAVNNALRWIVSEVGYMLHGSVCL